MPVGCLVWYNLIVNEGVTKVEIGRLCKVLEESYGRSVCQPEHGALDELVRTILSQTTTAANYNRAFCSLRNRYPTWEAVRQSSADGVEDAIRSGGLAKVKSGRIKGLLDEIHERHGTLSLDFLYDMPDEEARTYLMGFYGVGIKTASCVLMFSMNRPVFPVDTHVQRISHRLALIDRNVGAEEAHYLLGEMIPDEDVYSLHVNLVTHGRRVCKARNPACDLCPLLEVCGFGQKSLASGGI